MSKECANPAVERAERHIRELLQEIDSQAEKQRGKWADKRDSERRAFQASCRIRHLSPDGTTVLTTPGRTRDVSAGGLSFVSKKHLSRKSPLVVTIAVCGGQARQLIGSVVYSRSVAEEWYLTGMDFTPVDDVRLTESSSRGADSKGPPTDSKKQQEVQTKMDNTQAPISKRDQALAVLAAAGASCSMSKNTVNKVILLAGAPDQAVRHATIPVLMQVPRHQAVQVLVRLLGDVNSTIQVDAADALGQLQATEAAEPLRELLRHEDPEVAIRAAETLGKMDDKSGLGVLMRCVRSDTSLNRRAARALGVLLGQRFRPNSEGVAAARRYLKVNKIK